LKNIEHYRMWIDGKRTDAESGETYPVFNPATGEEFTRISLASEVEVDKAVKAAQTAFPIWSEKSPEERTRIMKEIALIIRKHTQELIDMDILDHGSPIGVANMFGGAVAGLFEEAGELSKNLMVQGEINVLPGVVPYLRREPIGVVACIVPWNVPLMVAIKIADSLATGNTCVVKPPSVDSIAALQIVEMMSEHPDLTPGAVNVITGPGGSVGKALASHPGVRMISFTGSCETGKDLMIAASQTVKRLFLELGGKNPFIVLEDADEDYCAVGAAEAIFFNTGMICGSPGRFYIHEKLHDKFVEKLIVEAKKIVVGDPKDAKTTMGPVVSAEHRDKVEGYIKLGVQEGAKVAFSGKKPGAPLDKGYFVSPTVFTNVTQNMRITREEIFGPVACILKYSSDDNIIDLANDNTFGLQASVWTKDYDKAIQLANDIQAGYVSINTHSPAGALPRGGFKESGFGKEAGGIHGLREYTQLKAIALNLAGGSHGYV
jgi:acyl-CoA reductase-like NAD-dependent aldehyde dehydrogenase